MLKLQTPLIADASKRKLSALGYKQINRIVAKAAEVKGLHRYSKDFAPVKNQVIALVHSLIFEHGITKEQLSVLQRNIKVVNNQLELPSIASLTIK